MRCHKKTKESGFFEGDSDSDAVNMGKALKRTNVFTASGDTKRKVCERMEYTTEELETHIRSTDYSKKGRYCFDYKIQNFMVDVYDGSMFSFIHDSSVTLSFKNPLRCVFLEHYKLCYFAQQS